MILSLLLLLADTHSQWLRSARNSLQWLTLPVVHLADLPSVMGSQAQQSLTSRSGLQDRVGELETKNLLLMGQVQKLAALKAENTRLRELLNSSAMVNSSVLTAEIISTSPDPEHHEVVINKGEAQDVFVGQPVLGGQGLMGQVTAVGKFSARVLMITDKTHALSVQVNRNGVRAIAAGGGSADLMTLQFVPDTADIEEGDLLVSSGLGGLFPMGYPVAKVTKVSHDPGQPYAHVTAKPTAKIDSGRYVLLVFNAEPRQQVIASKALGWESD